MTLSYPCAVFQAIIYAFACQTISSFCIHSPFKRSYCFRAEDEFALKMDLLNFLWFSMAWIALNGIPVNMMKSHMSWCHVQRNDGLCTQYLLEPIICSVVDVHSRETNEIERRKTVIIL